MPLRIASPDPLREGRDGMKPATLLAAIVLDIVAVAHVLRLAFHTEVIVGGTVIPMWVSAFGCVMPALLSIMVLREARPKRV